MKTMKECTYRHQIMEDGKQKKKQEAEDTKQDEKFSTTKNTLSELLNELKAKPVICTLENIKCVTS